MFWAKHWDIPIYLAAFAVLMLQQPIKPPVNLVQGSERTPEGTSERTLAVLIAPAAVAPSAVQSANLDIIHTPRLFETPPENSIEYRLPDPAMKAFESNSQSISESDSLKETTSNPPPLNALASAGIKVSVASTTAQQKVARQPQSLPHAKEKDPAPNESHSPKVIFVSGEILGI